MAAFAGETTMWGVNEVLPCGLPSVVCRPVLGVWGVFMRAIGVPNRHGVLNNRDREAMRVIRSKGHLNPGAAGLAFDRFELGLEALVRHVWVARWSVPAGQACPQRVLTYPAFNIVFTPEAGAMLHGPDRRSRRKR